MQFVNISDFQEQKQISTALRKCTISSILLFRGLNDNICSLGTKIQKELLCLYFNETESVSRKVGETENYFLSVTEFRLLHFLKAWKLKLSW